MLWKTYILLFLVGMSFALPTQEEPEASPAEVGAEGEGAEEPVDETSVDEVEAEGEEGGDEGGDEGGEGEDQTEEPATEEICEYTDEELGQISITFIEDDTGATALEITPDTIENIDERLEQCLSSSLSGRRTLKGSKRRRKGNKNRRRGGAKVRNPAQVLRMMRQKVRGGPKDVTLAEMKEAIKLGQKYLRVMKKRSKRGKTGKAGRRNKKGKGNKRRLG